MKTSRFVLVVFLLIVIIILMAAQLIVYKQQGGKCVANPLVYGVNGLSNSNGAEIQCMCFSNKPNSGYLLVTKNSTSYVSMDGIR